MFNYLLGLSGVGCLLWVLRIPITFLLYFIGFSISVLCNWEWGKELFSKECNFLFYYHPEWFNWSPDDPDFELWRKSFEECNLGGPPEEE
tara:strand:- start:507 stop:776 length:270 start_codon:yes stop_codon:yes gene_type:complete